MMKKLLFTINIILVASLGFAQVNIYNAYEEGSVVNNETIEVVGDDDDMSAALYVVNNTDTELNLKCRLIELNVLSGTSNSTCWVICPLPVLAGENPERIISFNGTELVDVIAVSDTGGTFTPHYYHNDVQGCSLFKYEIYDSSDESTILATVQVRFVHTTSGVCSDVSVAEEFSNNIVMNAFPNPIVNNATIEYELPYMGSSNSLVVYDMLGSIVADFPINSKEGRVNISSDNFKAGVYFYALQIDNETLMSKKLIFSK